jgi:Fanconi anemia group M protein
MSNLKSRIGAKQINSEFLKSNNLEYRQYQLSIANKCIGKNSLVVLPTGLGKTIIAVLIAAKTLEISPPNSKIIIMAPTRPLINQHFDTFLDLLTIPQALFCILTGKISPDIRPQQFHNHKIIFFTPQTLRNDIVAKKYGLGNVCLMIFDEAHHASGDYPYTLLAEEYIEQNPDGMILALTASPGASKEKINELCKMLYIPSDNIHIRIRKDFDVKDYIKPMDIFKIGVNLTSLMEDVRKVLHTILEECLQYLSRLGFIPIKSSKLYQKIIRKDLLELNRKLVAIISGDGDKTGAYKGLSVNAQGLILFHMLELVEQQGLDILLIYLDKLKKEARKSNSSKANRILASDSRIRRMHLELLKRNDLDPTSLIHPKFLILKKILLDELAKNPDSRILVFVKLRASVKNIVKRLKKINKIKAVRFVGQAKKSKDDKGLTQTQQLEILKKFKQGEYNVLVSTNVAEEGLDIAECDLVIFYDVVASEIRLIQRKGRTARHREGKVIILYCRNTNDETYLLIALNRLKRMKTNLKKGPAKLINSEKISAQSNLRQYIKSKSKQHSQKGQTVQPKTEKSQLTISSKFPMKFGLRKRLRKAHINFNIQKTDFHLILFNSILIQILHPKEFLEAKLKGIYDKQKNRFKLIVFIFDFTEFQESFTNEKQLFKQKLLDFGSTQDFQIIPIDVPDELFFVVKNIFQHKNKNKIKDD